MYINPVRDINNCHVYFFHHFHCTTFHPYISMTCVLYLPFPLLKGLVSLISLFINMVKRNIQSLTNSHNFNTCTLNETTSVFQMVILYQHETAGTHVAPGFPLRSEWDGSLC